MNEMLKAVPHRTFTTSQRRSRAKMEEAISDLPQDKYDLLCGVRLQPFMFKTVCKPFIWFTFTIYLLVGWYAVNRLNSKQ